MINKFYENTINANAHQNIIDFIEHNNKIGLGIDLGCGTGRDTIYLIKNKWKVIAIDKEDTKLIIESKLNDEEKKRLLFVKQEFENINLEKNDLIVANFSIPFCSKNKFNKFWNIITDSLSVGGFFVGNFLGKKDSWNGFKEEMTFLDKVEVLNLFNKFKIHKFEEIERDGKTAIGKNKHWHIYEITAEKINN